MTGEWIEPVGAMSCRAWRMMGRADGFMAEYCTKLEGHEGPHESQPMTYTAVLPLTTSGIAPGHVVIGQGR